MARQSQHIETDMRTVVAALERLHQDFLEDRDQFRQSFEKVLTGVATEKGIAVTQVNAEHLTWPIRRLVLNRFITNEKVADIAETTIDYLLDQMFGPDHDDC